MPAPLAGTAVKSCLQHCWPRARCGLTHAALYTLSQRNLSDGGLLSHLQLSGNGGVQVREACLRRLPCLPELYTRRPSACAGACAVLMPHARCAARSRRASCGAEGAVSSRRRRCDSALPLPARAAPCVASDALIRNDGVPQLLTVGGRLLRIPFTTVFDYLQLLRLVAEQLQARPRRHAHACALALSR